jgi:MFS family permease
MGPRAALRLVGSRRLGPFLAGRALASCGTWMHNLAAGILIFRLTGSELLLGTLAIMQFLPTLLLAPVIGRAADRYDRGRVVIATQLFSTVVAAALALLVWADAASVPVVLGLSLALGVANSFAIPAGAALLSGLVDAADLESAVALNSMTFNLARAVGPVLAAVAIGTLGIPAAFALNAASYLALAVAVLFVGPLPASALARGAAIRLWDTVALVRGDARLWGSLVVIMVVGFAADPINTLSPAFAVAFDRPDTDAGFVIGAFGAGAVTAAIAFTGRLRLTTRRLGAALCGLGGGIVLFSLAPAFGPALVLVFLAGICYLSVNAAATSRVQLGVEEAHRGRVMALWSVAFLGMRPLASFVDGAIASVFGVRAAGIVLALPAVAAGLTLALTRRRTGSRYSAW